MKTQRERVKVQVRGAVQGVGFRPFVCRVAASMNLRGRVLNSAQGVSIEAEGPHLVLQDFVLRVETEKPPLAVIQSIESTFLDIKNRTVESVLEELAPKAKELVPALGERLELRAKLVRILDDALARGFGNDAREHIARFNELILKETEKEARR